jgi:hypothetical protein
MFAMKKILLLVALSLGHCFAGDIIQTADGEYAGYINGRMITTASSTYGGVILNRKMIVDADSSYGGFVTRGGTVIDASQNTAGFISRWRDVDVE